MKTKEAVGVGGIFGQVRLAFGPGLEIKHEPKEIPKGGEEVLGVLADPVIRGFYSEAADLRLLVRQESLAHISLHMSGQAHGSDACEAFHQKTSEMESKAETLSKLFWEGVFSVFPKGNSYGIRAGWQVICRDNQEVKDAEFLFAEKHPVTTFFEDVRQAFSLQEEKDLPVVDLDLKPVDMEAEEAIIGQVTDLSVKALFLIRWKLIEAIEAASKDFTGVTPGKSVPQALVMAMAKVDCLKGQYNTVDTLVWEGIRENLGLSAEEHPTIGLRKDWTVVHCPPDEDDDGKAEMLDMLEALFGRHI